MKATATVSVLTFFFALTKSASIDEILNGTETETAKFPVITGSDLTEAQKFTLDKFRFKVEGLLRDEYENTDEYLLGWLRGAKWNTFSAEQLLRRSIQWKKLNNVVELGKEETPSDLLQLFPYKLDAKDKNGCPVLELNIPKWDVSSYILKHEYPRDAVALFKKYNWQMFEKAERLLRKNSKQCQQYTMIMDLNGFSMDTISDFYSLSAITGLIRTYEQNYPGAMKILYAINAPQDIRGPLEIFKPVLTNQLIGKANFYFGEEEWRPILSAQIDEKELSARFGGLKDGVFELS